MTKFKKQLIGVKINHFFKTNKLVLFFHCNSKVVNKLHIIKRTNSTEGLRTLQIKSKIAVKCLEFCFKQKKKAFGFEQKEEEGTQIRLGIPSILEPESLLLSQGAQNQNQRLPIQRSDQENSTLSTHEKQYLALFQGPTLLLGFTSLKILENILKTSKQDLSFLLLGGIYEGTFLLDQVKIERLAHLSKRNDTSACLIKQVQTPTFRSILVFKKALSFSVLKEPLYKLLSLLKYRNNQMSGHLL